MKSEIDIKEIDVYIDILVQKIKKVEDSLNTIITIINNLCSELQTEEGRTLLNAWTKLNLEIKQEIEKNKNLEQQIITIYKNYKYISQENLENYIKYSDISIEQLHMISQKIEKI